MPPKLLYRNVEVELDGDYKKGNPNVAIRAVEGKPFRICSFLRHHRGIGYSTAYKTVDINELEVQA